MKGIRRCMFCAVLAVVVCDPCFGAKAEQKIEGSVFGPTGIIGSLNGNAIAVAGTQNGSPAAGKLKKGDVITGIGNKPFSNTPARDIAAAVDVAEGSAANGKMTLLLKSGGTVDIHLASLGDYSQTAPYNCPKTDKIIRMTADQLMNQEPGGLAIELLSLMATGVQKYMDAAAKHIRNADWAKLDGNPLRSQLYCTWRWGYHNPQHDLAPAIELLAGFTIKVGLDYAVNIEQLRPKAKHSFRLLAQWRCLSAYGGNAKDVLATLKANSKTPLDSGRLAGQGRPGP